jgi:hypothetical protein
MFFIFEIFKTDEFNLISKFLIYFRERSTFYSIKHLDVRVRILVNYNKLVS